MAHRIYEVEAETKCPRCGGGQARIGIYHFGLTYQIECATCAFGQTFADSEAQAIARYRGKALEMNSRTLPPAQGM